MLTLTTGQRRGVIEGTRNREGWYWDNYQSLRLAGVGASDALAFAGYGLNLDKLRTCQSIAEQLTEDTGTHMLDSGGANGRHRQRDKGMDWVAYEKRPAMSPEVWDKAEEPDPETGRYAVKELYWTMDVYHMLARKLTYSPELDAKFVRYGTHPDRERECWTGLVDGWLEAIDADGPWFGKEPVTVNTYNGDSALSRVLQYTAFELDGATYVAMATHNGADVRGGYSRPRIYEVDDDDAMGLDGNSYTIFAVPVEPERETMFGTETIDTIHWMAYDGGCHVDCSDDGVEFNVEDTSVDSEGKLYWTHPQTGVLYALEAEAD